MRITLVYLAGIGENVNERRLVALQLVASTLDGRCGVLGTVLPDALAEAVSESRGLLAANELTNQASNSRFRRHPALQPLPNAAAGLLPRPGEHPIRQRKRNKRNQQDTEKGKNRTALDHCSDPDLPASEDDGIRRIAHREGEIHGAGDADGDHEGDRVDAH